MLALFSGIPVAVELKTILNTDSNTLRVAAGADLRRFDAINWLERTRPFSASGRVIGIAKPF